MEITESKAVKKVIDPNFSGLIKATCNVYKWPIIEFFKFLKVENPDKYIKPTQLLELREKEKLIMQYEDDIRRWLPVMTEKDFKD